MRRFFRKKKPKLDPLEKPETKKALNKADRALLALDGVNAKQMKELVSDAIRCLPHTPDFREKEKARRNA